MNHPPQVYKIYMEESNPWPTFVDAFSTVLCIFIFLMLVFVLNSMLIMYESAKKHYVPLVTAPVYSDKKMPDMTSLPTETEAKQKNNHTEPASQTSEADRTDSTEVTEAVTAANASQAAGNAEAAQAAETADSTGKNERRAVAQAEVNNAPPAATPVDKRGNASPMPAGRYDVHEKTPAFEIKGNQFVIHFQKNEQSFPPEIIGKLKEWLKAEHTSTSVNVYTNSNKAIAVSDAMRLAYQRGIMLLKVVKENEVNQDVAISVINDAGVMSNSAVITKVE